ncbi:BLUF domain-containing protein [Methylobacterium radiotolerans]|uniref:BLUF domain-containing protein n=1 Tax=Methylobacterium radiotolerans TaxID=31998 RepID=UPI001F1B8F38|nr:BLUF domain-containing protein [Methylobacterium radiotolerans]UIY43514.1 BLUF domain-containing protein [Methylobacterium radiotolerans]
MIAPDHIDLFRLVYRSRNAIGGDAEEVHRQVDRILTVSRSRNAQAGVTGALMFTGLFFVQALEGPTAAVEATFDRICCDLRHSNVEVVECGPVLEPAFGEWSMSHLVPTADAGALLNRVEYDDELADAAAAAMKLMIALIRSEPHAMGETRRHIV